MDDGKSVLLLEAGIRKRTILAGYMDLLMRVQGCLITHEHQDHAKAALGLPMAGIDVYASGGTFSALNAEKDRRNYRLHSIKAGEQFTLGTWTVLPWEAQHDAAEPLGFLLHSKETRDKLIFATDTYFIPNTFRGSDLYHGRMQLRPNIVRPQYQRWVCAGVSPAAPCAQSLFT